MLYLSYNYLKYKFMCLLTKDLSKTSSIENIKITNYTLSFFYYADNCFFMLTD